jgi:hypothetical protein
MRGPKSKRQRRRRFTLHALATFSATLLFVGIASSQGKGQPEAGRHFEKQRGVSDAKSKVPPAWNLGPLGAQTAQLQRIYGRLGHTQRLRPRLLEQGTPLPVVIPEGLLNPETEDCVTVTALAAANLSFLLVFDDEESPAARRAWPVPSAAGVAEVTRCGARKPLLAGLSAQLRSRRGVVELLIVKSEQPPPPVTELLVGRDPGPSLPSPQVGPRPALAPIKQRVEEALATHKADGALATETNGALADEAGVGSLVMNLLEGCHRFSLLTEGDPKSPPDLDARLYSLTSGEDLVTDEEHRGEAHLDYCVGRADRVRLDFSGAKAQTEITVVHSRWEIPEGIPRMWGSYSRARLAGALWHDHLPALESAPAFASLGVRGATRLFVDLDPEACYVVAVAPIRGEVTTLSLTAEVGDDRQEATGSGGSEGLALSACANGYDQLEVDVHALGSGLAWILGVWQLGTPEGLP